jgi:NADH-quinone oxidoreductase subunit J
LLNLLAEGMGGLTLTPDFMAFGAVAGFAAMAAVGVVAFNNAVRSALCLVLNFFALAILYFTLNAETLGITQIVVYTGAIMVLFLFVIMLLNLGAPQILKEKQDPKVGAGLALGVVLFAVVSAQVLPGLLKYTSPRAPDTFGAPKNVGSFLFTGYVVPFEAVSFLLLVGVVGSILLAKRRI